MRRQTKQKDFHLLVIAKKLCLISTACSARKLLVPQLSAVELSRTFGTKSPMFQWSLGLFIALTLFDDESCPLNAGF